MKMKRAYKFLREEWAICAIKDRRIKISEIDDLNDVAELLPYRTSTTEQRDQIQSARADLIKRARGLMSFSLNWTSPLLWAHYADKHKGICLGFDLPDENALKVRYVDDRLPFPREVNEQVALDWILTKSADWRYEAEVRFFVKLDQKEDGHYFVSFDEKMLLREVVLGFKCSRDLGFVRALLPDYTENINVIKAGVSSESFQMIEDESGP